MPRCKRGRGRHGETCRVRRVCLRKKSAGHDSSSVGRRKKFHFCQGNNAKCEEIAIFMNRERPGLTGGDQVAGNVHPGLTFFLRCPNEVNKASLKVETPCWSFCAESQCKLDHNFTHVVILSRQFDRAIDKCAQIGDKFRVGMRWISLKVRAPLPINLLQSATCPDC